MDDYYDVDAIGAGGFAVVRKVRHKTTAETYAMKIIGVKEDGDETEDKGEHGKERMSMSGVTERDRYPARAQVAERVEIEGSDVVR